MRRIIDLETLFEWARERCKDNNIPIWIGEDAETKDIMLIVGTEYAVIHSYAWLHEMHHFFNEAITMAEEKYKDER